MIRREACDYRDVLNIIFIIVCKPEAEVSDTLVKKFSISMMMMVNNNALYLTQFIHILFYQDFRRLPATNFVRFFS